ncbi:COX15/CtaA family protein [Crocinitomicaceae bacterium CZZ-1]|uniref:COX15/CtaA family protein n=1 Tax=Taishania pollutisoli TaxID=2766479 RepID=A0A8J6PEA7_9FLAO|nr:COX15/CtaA family protein [Taishania pollutisoli]
MVKRLKKLQKFNWVVLILIFLVVVAGSFVRVTGSGMGCPDWPKCFGYWVPPTEAGSLPADYKETYAEGRVQKIEKFARFLSGIGLDETAAKIKNDPNLLTEQEFNAAKTWTEYVNRLCGFLAGNGMLLALVWLLVVYRKRKFILLSLLNLVIMGFQAWFGSIVVASNLVPWTITVHMLLALVILAIQLYLIHLIGKEIELHNDSLRKSGDSPVYRVPKWMYWLIVLSMLITTYQIFLGTQVREMIDEMTIQGVTRQGWSSQLGLPFFIHRSFSWMVLIFIVLIAWKNEQGEKIRPIRWLLMILSIELVSGIVLVYGNMPGMVQIAHLFFAVILFCIFTLMLFRLKIART